MRVALLALCVVCLGLSGALVQASPVESPSVHLAPANGPPLAPRTLSATGLPSNELLTVLVIDPVGGEQTLTGSVDATGKLSIALQPPSGGWPGGLYRVVLRLGNGKAISGTFVSSDGKPHLIETPDLPSPNSALSFVGTGLPPNTNTNVVVVLTSARGEQLVSGRTDADGTLVSYLWPEQLGAPFFSAGLYKVTIPDQGLSADFAIREHPASSTITVLGSVLPNGSATVHFQNYRPNRMLWAVVANLNGRIVDQFIPGTTDARGALNAELNLADLPPGRYLLATPYEWGETSLDVLAPTPTATDTPTPTPTRTPRPKATGKPTATATPKAAAHAMCKQRAHRKPGKCSSKGRVRV